MYNNLFELSHLQMGIWSRTQLYEENGEYNVPMLIQLDKRFSHTEIEHALNSIVEYNAALRTEVVGESYPKQRINTFRKFNLLIETVEERELNGRLEKFISKSMSLKSSLADFKLFVTDKLQILACRFHHIIVDGHSVKLFENELKSILDGKKLYKDKTLYEQHIENNLNISQDVLEYWEKYLGQRVEFLEQHKRAIDEERCILTTDLKLDIRELRNYAKFVKSSIFTSSLGIYKMFLSRFFNKDSIPVGIPVTTRKNQDDDCTIAFMANVVPLILTTESKETGEHFQNKVRETVIDLILHSDISTMKMQTILEGRYNEGIEAFFKTVFDVHEEEEEILTYLVKKASTESEYKWLSNIKIKSEKVYFETNHDCSFYPKWFMEEIHKSFYVFIHSVLKHPEEFISNYDLLSKEQYNNLFIVEDIRCANTTLLNEKECIISKKNNKDIAISYQELLISYQELNNYWVEFKNFLKKNNIGKGAKFVVCTKNKQLGCILFYCIQRSQCCYIPISSELPEKRIKQIIDESKPMATITDCINNLHYTCIGVFNCEDLFDLGSKEISLELNDSTNYLEDIAYIIFTSGSTGRPKGVPISYKNLRSLVVQYEDYFFINSDDIIAQVASLSFDASLFEMTLVFSSGAQLAIFDNLKGYEKFPEFIKEKGVTKFVLTPDYYSILDLKNCISLKSVIVAGDAYRVNKTLPKHVVVYNAYGPSEGTIMTTFKKMDKNTKPYNIGKPLRNSFVVLLGSNGEIIPHGEIGEICITGNSVFNKYLNEVEEEYFQSIFIKDKEYLFYRTGDFAFLDENKDLNFISRKKNFIKIRGNRVDLDEISQLFMLKDKVSNVITILNNSKIFVFYTGEKCNEILWHTANEYLPNYMIPRQIQYIEHIPVTVNGKTNISELKAMLTNMTEIQTNKTQSEQILDSLELVILTAFRKILKNNNITLNSNFFTEGGDSIQSIQIANELQREGWNISSLDIMKCNDIQELCNKYRTKRISFDQNIVVGQVGLLPIQTWFFKHNFFNINHWNQSENFTIEGEYTDEQLIEIYNHIRIKHDNLRSCFILKDKQYVNIIRENLVSDIEKEISFYDYNKKPTELGIYDWSQEITEQLNMGIDISKGILSKIAFVKMPGKQMKIIWVIHHLVCDNVSWSILKNDFLYALGLINQNKKLKLTEKTTNIKDWIDFITSIDISKEVKKQWYSYIVKKDNMLNGFDELKILDEYETHMFNLTNELSDKILNISQEIKIEKDLLILLLFGKTLCKNLSKKNVWILRELNGRSNHLEDIQLNQTVGWFTSIHPVKVKDFDDVDEFISMNQFDIEKISKIGFEYQFICEEDIVPNISYNYLGELDKSIDIKMKLHNSNINKFDFFDEIALNVGRQNDKFILIFLAKKRHNQLILDIVKFFNEFIDKLSVNNRKKFFGISSETLIELNDLFI